ncbi:MAG: DUF935 family protein, partial [Gammaproteobacteria bacterium]|nr:DUF935 family protein [Gammaproteobacteria bacterium]
MITLHTALQTLKSLLFNLQPHCPFQQRRLAAVSKNWEVQPGGKARIDVKAADCLRENPDHISFDRATNKMLFGVFYGYSVAENIYVRDGRQAALDAVKVRNRIRFGFDIDFQLRLMMLQNPNGEVTPARKFRTFHTGADHDDEPYGIGLAHWLYWPVFFKR